MRMGAQATILYRRERKDMPAIDEEIQAAEEEGVRLCLSRCAAPHHRRSRRQRKSNRNRQDPARRVRQVRPPTAHSHRRGAALRVRQRHPGRRRNLRPGFLPRLRPGTQRRRHDLRRSIHPGNQPARLLRRWRRHHRRIQHVNAMSGGKQAARKIDERLMGDADDLAIVGRECSRDLNTAGKLRASRASAAASRRRPCRLPARRHSTAGSCRRTQRAGSARRVPPLSPLRFARHRRKVQT